MKHLLSLTISFWLIVCSLGYGQFTLIVERDTGSFLAVSPFGTDSLSPKDFVTQYDSFPDAEAVIIREGCQITGKYSALKKEVYRRTHILKEGALDLADITLTFNTYRKTLDYIYARTQNLEGDSVVFIEVTEEDYFMDESEGGEVKISFAFPQAKVGSIIDMAYGFSDKQQYYQNWTFQNPYPTLRSTFDVREGSLLRYNYYFQGSFQEKLEKSRYQNRTAFLMQDMPAIKEEPYVPCPSDYLPKIMLQVSDVGFEGSETYENSSKYLNQTWDEFSETFRKNKYTKHYGAKSKGLYKKACGDLEEESDPVKRMEAVYETIRDHMEWSGNFSMASIEKLSKVYKKKRASSGEINQLLIYCLRHAGLDAKPMLVATRTYGDPFQEFPIRQQFNTLAAYVKIADKVYVLDATAGNQSWKYIPSSLAYQDGWVLEEAAGGFWYKVVPQKTMNRINFAQMALDEKGGIAGTITHTFGGSYGASYRKIEEDDLQEGIEALLPEGEISQLALDKPDDKDRAVKVSYQFESADFAQRINDKLYVKPFLNFAFEDNPFKAAERYYPIDFGQLERYQSTMLLAIPDGFVLEGGDVQEMVRTENNLLTFQVNIVREGNILNISSIYSMRLGYFRAETYDQIRDFFDKMIQVQKRQLVLTKPVP
ncbi:MAG: DUF3857 domain-containing protein [Bacteroidota bacterium]